jgi:hypothetical protein
VSSDLKAGGHYHTEIKLLDRAQVNSLDMEALFKPFIRGLSSTDKCNVTILRSGYFPELQVPAGSSSAANAPTVESQTLPTRAYTAKDEHDSIRKVFREIASSGGFTYITLKEDKFLDLNTDTSAFLKSGSPSQKQSSALVLVRDTRMLDSNPNTIQVTHAQGEHARTGVITATIIQSQSAVQTLREKRQQSSRSSPWKAGNGPGNNSPGNSTTPLIQMLSAERNQRFNRSPLSPGLASLFNKDTPSRPKRNGDENSDIQALLSSTTHEPLDEDTETEHNWLNEMVDKLTESEVTMLARLWDGSELGLFGTKWPVLTHLAHLAAKRALLHLGTNDWEGAKGTDTVPYFLPEVHEAVRSSLYYL